MAAAFLELIYKGLIWSQYEVKASNFMPHQNGSEKELPFPMLWSSYQVQQQTKHLIFFQSVAHLHGVSHTAYDS